MGDNFYDIPFRALTPESDFNCKDGEIFCAEGLLIDGQDPSIPNPSSLNPNPQLPTPDLDFALVRETLPGWHALSGDFPAKTLAASDPSMEYWTTLAAGLLARFQTEATSQNLFTAPFYAMAAWKTFSGAYLSATDPVLMIPNNNVPVVATDDNVSAAELDFRIAGAVCGLYFRMRAPEVLRDFVGLIESLEILVSQPLLSYDRLTSCLPAKRVTSDTLCRCLDLATGEIADRRVSTVTLPLAWLSSTPLQLLNPSLRFRKFASIPLGEVDRADSWGKAGARGIGDSLYGAEADEIKYSSLLKEGEEASSKSAKAIVLSGKDTDFRLITRPLKLSGAGRLKRISHVRLRGHYTPANIAITLYGSRDMIRWWPIANREGGTMVSLPRSSFRFFRVELSGRLGVSETLEGLSID